MEDSGEIGRLTRRETMAIEDTKEIVELKSNQDVNKYLKAGWVLISQYIIDVGELGAPSGKPRFILSWQDAQNAPVHPEDTDHVSDLKEQERWQSRIKSKVI